MFANAMQLSLAENDQQGHFSDKLTNVEVIHPQDGETCLKLEYPGWYVEEIGAPIERNDRIIQVHGYRFKFISRHEWVGNWCWNQYWMPASYACGLINVLLRSRQWSIEEAYTELFDKWKRGELFTPRDFGFDFDLTQGFHIHSEPLGLFDDESHDTRH